MSTKNIWVIGSYAYGDVIAHLGNIIYNGNCLFARPTDLEKIDLIMFSGGEDVHPSLYNGVDNGHSYHNYRRDALEKTIFDAAQAFNIKVTGICRGFQFLNVMCGGKMYQHINNHAGQMHDIVIPKIDKKVFVTSTHHQLVKPNWDTALPVAWSEPSRSDKYIGPEGLLIAPPNVEIEAAVFPKFNAFGVQFHPEMMRPMEDGRQTYAMIMDAFLNEDINTFTEMFASEVDDVRKSRTTEAY